MMSASGSHAPRVAVVGATGVVGAQIVELLSEREFEAAELKLFSAEGGTAESGEAENGVEVASLSSPDDLRPFDLAFLAVPQSVAAEIARANPGPILIDLSSAERPPSNRPMVAPGFTPREQVSGSGANAIEMPHPCAHAIAAIIDALKIAPSMVGAFVNLSASTRGQAEMRTLLNESADLLNARLSKEDDEPQFAFNVFSDERCRRLAAVVPAQVERLLGNKTNVANVSIQVAQAPLFHGCVMSVFVGGAIDLSSATERLQSAPGVLLVEEEDPPEATEAIGQEVLLVSVRAARGGLALWCAFDCARRAASTALWIAECLVPVASRVLS